jgi:plasmid stability protein
MILPGSPMASLYIENVPRALYEALRRRARSHKHSIATEVLDIVEANVPTQKELKARRQLINKVCEMQSRKPRSRKVSGSTEAMLREDRER